MRWMNVLRRVTRPATAGGAADDAQQVAKALRRRVLQGDAIVRAADAGACLVDGHRIVGSINRADGADQPALLQALAPPAPAPAAAQAEIWQDAEDDLEVIRRLSAAGGRQMRAVRAAIEVRISDDAHGAARYAAFYRDLDRAVSGLPMKSRRTLLPAIGTIIACDLTDPAIARHLIDTLPTMEDVCRDGEVIRALLVASAGGQNDELHAALLDMGVGFASPDCLLWDATPAFVAMARERRWDIVACIGVDMRGAGKCVVSPTFRGPARAYELHPIPLDRDAESLRDLSEGGWAILGGMMGLAADGTSVLHVLVRPGDATAHDYRLERARDSDAKLREITERGARLLAGGETAGGACYLVDHAAGARGSYRWRDPGDLEGALRAALVAGETPCLAAGPDGGGRLLTYRPGAATSAVQAGVCGPGPMQTIRALLLSGAWSRAREALERLPADAAQATPWVRHRDAFIDVARVDDLLHNIVALAKAVATEASVDELCAGKHAFANDVIRMLNRYYRDGPERAWSEVFKRLRADPIEDANVRRVLAIAVAEDASNAIVPARHANLDAYLCNALCTPVAGNAPPFATLLKMLGADPDRAGGGGKSPRQQALESGSLWFCEALDGNDDAGHEALRLGQNQVATIRQRAQAAYEMSQAQRLALEARLAAMGESAEAVQSLRDYIRREAPLWVNFVPIAGNGLLGAESFRPKGVGNAKWADHYATSQPPECAVTYGWVNAQKSLAGYTRFGGAALVLRNHVRARVTVTARSKCADAASVGTLHALDHVLMELPDTTLRAMLGAMRGHKHLRRECSFDDEIIEMHVHGPLNLREDVRKINVAPFVDLSEPDCNALFRFALNNRLAIHWRGGTHVPRADRSKLLEHMGRQCMDVVSWYHDSSGCEDVICVRPRVGRVLPEDLGYIYGQQTCALEHRTRTLADLGHRGDDIVGIDMSSAAGGQRVAFVTRRDMRDTTPRTYALHRTYLPRERLAALGAQRWELMAYTQMLGGLSVTPEISFVARQSEHRWRYAWVKNRLIDGYPGLHNSHAYNAKNGWTLAGVHLLDAEHARSVFKRRLAEDSPAAEPEPLTGTPVNESTLMFEPLTSIPGPFRFLTRDNYMFDIEELVTLAEQKGALINGWNNQPLDDEDTAAVLAHPSGAGTRVVALLAQNETLMTRFTPATAAALDALTATLKIDPFSGALQRSTEATEIFSRHVSGASPQERVAIYGAKFSLIDTHGQAFHLSIMAAVVGLQTGAGCSRATSRYLQEMAACIRVAVAERR